MLCRDKIATIYAPGEPHFAALPYFLYLSFSMIRIVELKAGPDF